MARVRDYQAEYRRRIELGEARGVSRSEARGHRSYADAQAAIRRAPAFAPITSSYRTDQKTGRITAVVIYVPDRKGQAVAYTLKPRPGETGRQFEARLRRIARTPTKAPWVIGYPNLIGHTAKAS